MNAANETQCVIFPGGQFRAEHRVHQARRSGEKVFVIYDWMAFPTDKPARNLIAYDLTGNRLWVAEDLGMGDADGYVGFESPMPLIVYNFAGYACMIDEESGRVLGSRFTK
jgi:hypothetical protein